MGEGCGMNAVWKGHFLEMHITPHGASGRWEFVKRIKGIQAAVILAITDRRDIILVEQYRPPLGKACIELPAGLVGDDGADENPIAAAKRELLEETGYTATNWDCVGEFASSPGMVGEIFHLYRATGLSRQGPGGGVEGEGITVHSVPLLDLPAFIKHSRARGCAIDTRLLLGLGLV